MSRTKMDVDIGVVTWNTAEVTVGALRRLLDNDQGCAFRLLVRDNGSTDGTPLAIAAEVPEAELDAGTQNLGFAAGVNSLLARSDAPYFLMLNSDAWPQPGAVRTLLDAAGNQPHAAAVAPRIERPDGTLEHSAHPLPSTAVSLRAVFGTGWTEAVGDTAQPVGWAVGAALLLRRAAVDDIGGFDESLFMYAEDLEWCWRARRRGWEIWFEPAAVVRHVGNASGEQAYGNGRTAAHLRNAYRVYRRERGAARTAAYRALNVAGSAVRLAASRARADDAASRWWAEQVRGHLGRPGRP